MSALVTLLRELSIGGIVLTLVALGQDRPFDPEVSFTRETKMMLSYHFNYFIIIGEGHSLLLLKRVLNLLYKSPNYINNHL